MNSTSTSKRAQGRVGVSTKVKLIGTKKKNRRMWWLIVFSSLHHITHLIFFNSCTNYSSTCWNREESPAHPALKTMLSERCRVAAQQIRSQHTEMLVKILSVYIFNCADLSCQHSLCWIMRHYMLETDYKIVFYFCTNNRWSVRGDSKSV